MRGETEKQIGIWKLPLKHSLPFCDPRYWLMECYNESWGKICHCCWLTAVFFASIHFHVLNFYIHNFNDQQLWVNGIRDTLNKINWKRHFMAIKCAIQMLVCFRLISYFIVQCHSMIHFGARRETWGSSWTMSDCYHLSLTLMLDGDLR